MVLMLTIENGVKPLPFNICVNPEPPAKVVVVANESSTGTGFPTVKLNSAEVPPPGVGVKTDNFKAPAVAKSARVNVMPSCVAEVNVVGRSAPLTRTTEFERKLLPVNVNGVAALLSNAENLSSEVKIGAGLLIDKELEFEVPPPGAGLKTLSAAVPAFAISAGVTRIDNCDAETKVVTRSAPLNLTMELLIKLLPLMASVNVAPPAMADAGLSEAIAGVGLLMVKFVAVDNPPPGNGLKTAKLNVPADVNSEANN